MFEYNRETGYPVIEIMMRVLAIGIPFAMFLLFRRPKK